MSEHESERPTLPDAPLPKAESGEYNLQFAGMLARIAQLEGRVAELEARLPPKPAAPAHKPVVAREVILPPANDPRRED